MIDKTHESILATDGHKLTQMRDEIFSVSLCLGDSVFQNIATNDTKVF